MHVNSELRMPPQRGCLLRDMPQQDPSTWPSSSLLKKAGVMHVFYPAATGLLNAHIHSLQTVCRWGAPVANLLRHVQNAPRPVPTLKRVSTHVHFIALTYVDWQYDETGQCIWVPDLFLVMVAVVIAWASAGPAVTVVSADLAWAYGQRLTHHPMPIPYSSGLNLAPAPELGLTRSASRGWPSCPPRNAWNLFHERRECGSACEVRAGLCAVLGQDTVYIVGAFERRA